MTVPPSRLAARAIMAAHHARDADPHGFPERHQDWHIGVPVEQISVIDDPHRVYGAVPGDLLIDTEPGTDREWRFVPDLGATETFLLLDDCPDCGSAVPITRVATLADLGDYLDTDHADYDPARGCPDEFSDDPAHHPDCGFATRPPSPYPHHA